MWWVIGAIALFIMLFCYCACVLAGRADGKKREWFGQEEEGALKSIPPEKELSDKLGSEIYSTTEPSYLLLSGSSLLGTRKKIQIQLSKSRI